MDIFTCTIIFLTGFFIGLWSESKARNWYLKNKIKDKDKQ